MILALILAIFYWACAAELARLEERLGSAMMAGAGAAFCLLAVLLK